MAGVQGFEPWKWRNQNPLPYRLAIPQVLKVDWQGYLGSNQGVTGSKPVALPLGYTPNQLS